MGNLSTFCPSAIGPFFKPASVEETSGISTIKVYPTLLQNWDNNLHFEINASAATTITVIATSVDGRIVGNYKAELKSGANKLIWEMPAGVPGNYILNIASADNTIQKTQRISKL